MYKLLPGSLEAGLIRSIKYMYHKQLLKDKAFMVDEGEKASDIIQRVDILRVIYWLKSAWENVFPDTIKHCFQNVAPKISQ